MSERGQHPPQEADTLPFGRLLLILAGSLAIMLALSLWAWGERNAAHHRRRPDGMHAEQTLGAPRTRQGVEEAIFSLDAPGERLAREQKDRLTRFEWIDRQRGIVRIPVDDAIDLWLLRGQR